MSQNKEKEEFKNRLGQVAKSIIEIAKEEGLSKSKCKTDEKGEKKG